MREYDRDRERSSREEESRSSSRESDGRRPKRVNNNY